MNRKAIYLLIGPKGSGKSFIGALLEQHYGLKFIRVEAWAKHIKGGRQMNDPSYLDEVFKAIENGIREALRQHDAVVFESTGLTDNFDQMLKNLKEDFRVVTFGIQASDALCLQRVRARDQSLHINVSDSQVNAINKQVRERQIKTDFILFNENKSEAEILKEIKEQTKAHSR